MFDAGVPAKFRPMKTAHCGFVFLTLSVALFAADTAEQRAETRRSKFPVIDKARQMVENELLPQGGLTNPAVIDVMKRIPRNRFVPPLHQSIAFRDQAIAIGNAQTISPPYIVAYMTEQLDPKPGDKVLEIGTGSGYQAAVLSLLVDQVYSIEIVEPLGLRAEKTLKTLGMDNVHVRVGDGYKGWPEAAPFDSVIVTCSPESVPQPLIDQLREGGRMIIPIGERYQQTFYLCKKVDGKLEKERLTQALFVPMTGEAEDKREVQPDPNKPSLVGGGFEEVRDDGTPIGWHYARNVRVIQDNEAKEGARFARFTSNADPVAPSQGKNRVTSKPADGPQKAAWVLQGFAVDGRNVPKIRLEIWARGQNIVSTQGQPQTPIIVVWLYDEDRNQIGEILQGPCSGTFPWRQYTPEITIPKKTREAIILVGLPQASGQLDADGIVIKTTGL